MNTETAGMFGLFGVILVIALAVCAVIMPLVVIFIDHRVSKIQKILASMEDMMRNGR